jgi:hypothetical protein
MSVHEELGLELSMKVVIRSNLLIESYPDRYGHHHLGYVNCFWSSPSTDAFEHEGFGKGTRRSPNAKKGNAGYNAPT